MKLNYHVRQWLLVAAIAAVFASTFGACAACGVSLVGCSSGVSPRDAAYAAELVICADDARRAPSEDRPVMLATCVDAVSRRHGRSGLEQDGRDASVL